MGSQLQQLRLHLRALGERANVPSKAEEYIRHTEWYAHLIRSNIDDAKAQMAEDFIRYTEHSLRQAIRG